MGSSNEVLPDPTSELHFENFQGAIQDVFAGNADKHPQRLFVTETASASVAQRQFTYKQIHESSNVLAHHLLAHDIKRRDVVMVYAYRGVDLVVSILGVLKSGAAFSVIDPAYPSDRQCIYLDVAQPKGLIIIDKASREEGKLSVEVREWIAANLRLNVEVPGLDLQDDGTLTGGSVGEDRPDCLLEQQSLKAKHPGILVGPDSQPTLSFTSGSEGRPKGVKGRHFSLTYYTPWMARRFNLTEHDRFSMLSGIAHDPIQRDCFTPMFLGAQLIIPAKEDIQHGRLAAWTQAHSISVSHLTPAMGQILLGGADVELKALHHVFFGGDVLMKRDCRLLQNLAPKCRVVNMFGTTETQRAVSYYEVPSRSENAQFLDHAPDVIPAGRGMQDVQLLVVRRASLDEGRPQLCEVGEDGEIFVRAGGLAEGYLGSDDLNKARFIPNFFLTKPNVWAQKEAERQASCEREEPWRAFWNGPRDRLYRSGDLGRYTDTGDVECIGRADGQVKIRGFRIELGEIDTYLSQHSLVKENVTLLRRNKDEEPTIVSYFVIDLAKWPQWLQTKGLPDDTDDDSLVGMLKRFRPLRDDARASLRKKLPSYAVPSVFIPPKKMPVTPNYKVDKNALPYPDAADWAATVVPSQGARDGLTDTQKQVLEAWALRLRVPLDTLDLDDDFFEVGGHSLRAQEVLFDIKRWSGVSVSVATLFQNPTVWKFAAAVDAAIGQPHQQTSNITNAPLDLSYAADGTDLKANGLPSSFPSGPIQSQTILLTGATGFLGTGILVKLLELSSKIRIIALVRAKSDSDALARIKTSCTAYHHWSKSWSSRIRCIPADLSQDKLGVSAEVWHSLQGDVDIIIHNAAIVHWIKTYAVLKPTNVLSTLSLLTLCSVGKPKHFTFVSSTAVLDSENYDKSPVLESDDLSRSDTGLSNDYAQTKYVSEHLVREAGQRGLRCAVIRPGYVTGNTDSGIGPTDDFLIRMLKGCVQLSCRPNLGENTINLVPVSYCANVVVEASLYPLSGEKAGVNVYHVTPHPQMPFNHFTSTLEVCGYDCPVVSFETWRARLEKYVESAGEESHALLPLFDWVTDDLPSSTSSKVLDDSNVQALFRSNRITKDTTGVEVTQETVMAYLRFMNAIGFLAPPAVQRAEMGKLRLGAAVLGDVQKQALGKVGRGGA